jgi:RimJ/RimL family protein N-acetyltransferase
MSWSGMKNLVLENSRVRLRRVKANDLDAFGRVAYEPAIWQHFVAQILNPADLQHFVETAIQDTFNGTRIVFAIEDRRSGQIVGSTAFGNLAESERRLEIGWSWLAQRARGTDVNRAAKLALLEHAFGQLECERVEFKTDVLNTGARAALAAIGASEEGILRSFNYMPGGRRRNVIYYSILGSEWPTVRSKFFADVGI